MEVKIYGNLPEEALKEYVDSIRFIKYQEGPCLEINLVGGKTRRIWLRKV